jgi:hypothetical protein
MPCFAAIPNRSKLRWLLAVWSGVLKHLLRLLIVMSHLLMLPSAAATTLVFGQQTLSPQTKLALQSAVAAFIDNASDEDGGFRYIDRQTGALHTAYAGAVHPKIVPLGDDYFLCIEMLDSAGSVKLVDFLLRFGEAGWLVVDVIIDRRDLVKKALASEG